MKRIIDSFIYSDKYGCIIFSIKMNYKTMLCIFLILEVVICQGGGGGGRSSGSRSSRRKKTFVMPLSGCT
jgi:hypothetical protein